jgi:PAS domain S-box-containing protein
MPNTHAEATAAGASGRSLLRTPIGGYVLAVVVLLASLLVVALYWQTAHEREMRAAEAEFHADTDEITALLKQRLGSYELIVRGGVSLFASVARPSRQQWQDYVDGLDIGERFPALVGLGFAIHVSPGQLSDLQRMMHDSGEGLFSVHPHGPREHYGAILYLEPRTAANLAAIGYDMYSEPVRHSAMEAALVTGDPRMSGLIQLVQDNGESIPAVELFLPVYRAGDRPTSIAARRLSMQGWVYAPFRMAQFVAMALGVRQQRAWLRIVDVTDPVQRQLYADPRSTHRSLPAFRRSTMLELYGRRWRLDFDSPPLAEVESQIVGLRTTMGVGIFASLMLFGIALALARTQARAERLAARMSESYRRSELRFRSAMEFSAIGKALLDREGRIVEANPALANLLGKSPEQLIGRSFGALFVDGQDEDARSPGPEPLLEGVYRATRVLKHGDGGTRQAQLTFAPVPGDIGQDIARLVQIEDVTDRLRAEAEVLALNRTLEARVEARTRELTRANQELESFAYSVSHDLRAPLRAIDGFSRLLTERYGDRIDEEGREYLLRVRNAAGRMGTLIESLLKMARLARGGIKAVPLDLSRMAADIVAELRATEPERDVDIRIAPALRVVGDQSLVRSLLQNLLGNAWKFTCDCSDARIEFGISSGGEFFVRDNGAGFPQEYADKLFRPFQRLHSQEEFAGHGIGLASVKRIVERHGGLIRAVGSPGEGATFFFTLPGEPEPG